MVFGLFKKKDPICGMKEEKGKGITKDGRWFCSEKCLNEYREKAKQKPKDGCCCK